MTLTINDLIENLIANNDGKKDELITTIEKSANYGYKVAVDKACEWLEDNLHELIRDQEFIGTMCKYMDKKVNIEQFRKAMKGGEI